MLILQDYFGKFTHDPRQEYYPSADVEENAGILLLRVNALLGACAHLEEAQYPVVNSGWRPAAYNATISNAAPRSKHITGQAIDLRDAEGALDDHLYNRPDLLAAYELWMEHPLATKGWCHLQSVPPRSGNRIFIP